MDRGRQFRVSGGGEGAPPQPSPRRRPQLCTVAELQRPHFAQRRTRGRGGDGADPGSRLGARGTLHLRRQVGSESLTPVDGLLQSLQALRQCPCLHPGKFSLQLVGPGKQAEGSKGGADFPDLLHCWATKSTLLHVLGGKGGSGNEPLRRVVELSSGVEGDCGRRRKLWGCESRDLRS